MDNNNKTTVDYEYDEDSDNDEEKVDEEDWVSNLMNDDVDDKNDENKVDDEDCNENVMNDIKYDKEMRHEILLGISNELGYVNNSSKLLVEKRFRNKNLHVYATTYRTAMCYLARLQHDHRVSKGMGLQQAISARKEAMLKFDMHAFLFDKSPSSLVGNDTAFELLLAKLDWDQVLDRNLQIIRYSEDFLVAQEKITCKYLDEHLLMPRLISESVTGANIAVVSIAIGLFAAIRVYRDKIAPDVAFDLVVKSNGMDARSFFG